MPESLSSGKLNQSAINQNYLYERKLSARVKKRDVTSRANLGMQIHDVGIYAEHREISTSSENDGRVQFSKRFRFPQNFFAPGVMPVTFVKLGYRRGARTGITESINNPTPNGVDVRARSATDATFEEGMDYFANILAVGPTTTSSPANGDFMPVNFGTPEEDLPVSSLALNTLADNSSYLEHHRVKSVIRNVDLVSNDPDFYLRYLNDNLVVYGHYEEFYWEETSGGYNADKNNTTDQDVPKKFTRSFEFPNELFAPDIQPVVIYNVGAKVLSSPGTEVRRLTVILHDVKRKGFRLDIKENSASLNFASNQLYFCSYIAIGEEQRWD